MAKENNVALHFHYIFFWVNALLICLCHECAEARRHETGQKYLDFKPKRSIMTIKGDSDVIDCVDIYMQPAFDDPRITDLQIEHSNPTATKKKESYPKLIQDWHRYGECPQGTIPIRRTTRHEYAIHGRNSLARLRVGNRLNQSLAVDDGHEHAVVTVRDGVYHGCKATISVWNPNTEDNELSLSQVSVISDRGSYENLNSVQVGWMVNPLLYSDNQTRFFIYWTTDGYQSTGCYDLTCSGFVQTSTKIVVGSVIRPISTYDKESDEISIDVYKDQSNGNWWLELNGNEVGYWPATIFSNLSSANMVSWGGEIYNSRSKQQHTTTQMGSGHFSNEGYGKSSYFRNLRVIDDQGITYDPSPNMIKHVTNPSCYDLTLVPNKQGDSYSFMYYGGPGSSATCT